MARLTERDASQYQIFGKPDQVVLEVRERVEGAKRMRARLERDWLENIDMLDGDYHGLPDFNLERVIVNTFWSNAMAIIPSIYLHDPYITVAPKRAQDIDSAPIMEGALNYWIPKMGTKHVVHQCITDALAMPFGVAKSGYVMEEAKVELAVDKKTGEVSVYDRSKQYALSEHSIEIREFLLGQHPVLARVDPLQWYLDPRSTGTDNAEWACEVILRHIDEVKADRSYENTKGLQPTSRYRDDSMLGWDRYSVSLEDFKGGGTSAIDQRGIWNDLVELWEFWHRPTRRLIVVSPYHSRALRQDGWPYQANGFPYHQLRLNLRTPGKLYPMPPLSAIKPQANELNLLRSHGMEHVKRAKTMVFADGTLVDPNQQQQIIAGRILPLILTNGEPRNAVHVVTAQSMGNDVHIMEAKIQNDIRVVGGLPEFVSGGGNTYDSTATRDKLAAGQLSIRVEWMKGQVLDFVQSVACYTRDLIKQFSDMPQMVKITGRSDFQWREFTFEDIQGDYDVTIVAGSQLAQDPAVRQQMALNQFNLLAPIALQTGIYDIFELTKRLLEAYGEKNVDLIIKRPPNMNMPPQDPVMEDYLLKQGGVPKISPNDDDQLHLQHHYMTFQQATSKDMAHRVLVHIQEHSQSAMQKQMQMMAGMAAQMGGPAEAGGAPEGKTGQEGQQQKMGSMGQGRRGMTPGFPMAPRQFGEKPPTSAGIQRGATNSMGF